ncbi:MAG TPA: DUF3857 domain-containing protein, partial [Pseudomonadales bacterium]|nr:DUF3857 domain-containing protein [Pseudomonadales bacterium]
MIKVNTVVRWIAFSIAITYLPFPLLAQALLDKDAPDLDYRMGKIDIRYTINADGSFIENRAWEMTVLKESALEDSKTQRISYSTSIETSDIIEAYTRKPDGKRIDVPKDNFQIEANSGRGKDSPIFSDRTYLSIVFPDVSVGDTLVLAYKLTAKEPMFYNQFSTVETFSRNQAYDNVHIQIDSPETLWTQYKATDLKESSNETKDGRKIVTWQWSNPHPKKSKRQNYSVYNRETEPSLAFSTFHNYEEIAKAYGE